MTITKVITAALIIMSASASLASTKCDHKENGGLFASTNPPVKVSAPSVVKTAAAAISQTGTR